MGVWDIYNSDAPFLVVKYVYNPHEYLGAAIKMREAAATLAGSEVELGEVLARLSALAPEAEEVRVKPVFSPVDWFQPVAGGYYSWPEKTLFKYGLDRIRGIVIPVGVGDDEKRALLGLYRGIGIAVLSRSLGPAGVREEGVPVAVFIDARRIPRSTAVVMWDPGSGSAYILTASKDVANAMRGLPRIGEPVLDEIAGLPVYRIPVSEKVETRSDLEYIADQLRGKLSSLGILIYEHELKSGVKEESLVTA